MGKRIFWIFILLISATTAGLITYLQSAEFAEVLKKELKARVPANSGIKLDFDRLTVGILPPSISLTNVDLQVTSNENLLGLAQPTHLEIKRFGIAFKMLQAFSRGVKINKVFISDASLKIFLPPGGGASGGSGADIARLALNPIVLNVDKNLQLQLQQIEIRNSDFNISASTREGPESYSVKKVNYISLAPDFGRASAVIDLEKLAIENPRFHEELETLKLNTDISKQRIKVLSLDVMRKQETAHAEGQLVGSVMKPESLQAELGVIARGNLAELADQFTELKGISGSALAEVNVRGEIQKPEISGRVQMSDVRAGLWELDRVEVRGKWSKSDLSFSHLAIERRNGKILLDQNIDLPLPLKDFNSLLDIQFKDVAFEDFAGDLKTDVNNIRATLSGKLQATVKLQSNGKKLNLERIKVTPDLRVEQFELNNQTYGKNRPYKKIFGLHEFTLSGPVLFEGGDVKVENASMKFQSGSLSVNGSVSKSKGYDLHGSSQEINLGQEIGSIGGIDVFGHGGFDIHVHGKDPSILFDFDLHQQDARFANFDFGKLEGRVTLDDKNDRVILSGLKGKQNESSYEAFGNINIASDKDDLDVSLKFANANPDDIFKVFAYQLRGISWLPVGMTGAVSVSAKVGGGYDKGLDSLLISASVKGKHLYYKGETVTDVSADAGVNNGTIYARNITGRKYNSTFHGDVTFSPDEVLRYNLEVPTGKVRDWDYLTKMDFPVDGAWRISSRGQGKWETLKSETSIQVYDAYVRARPVPSFSLKFGTDAEKVSAKAETDNHAILASYSKARSERTPTEFDLAVKGSDFSYLLCSINRRSCSDPSLNFIVSGNLHMKWPGNHWDQANGFGEVSRLSLSRNDFSLGIDDQAKFNIQSGVVELPPVELVGESSKIAVSGKHSLAGTQRDWKFKGATSLKVFEFVTPLIEEGRGAIGIDFSIGGTAQELLLNGKLNINGGFMRLSGLDAPLEGLSGEMQFHGADLSIRELAAKLGGGDVRATGGMRFFLDKAPRMAFDLFLNDNRLRFFPVNYAEFSEARLSFAGDAPPYLFGGTAKVRKVLMTRNFDVGNQKKQRTARYLPEVLNKKNSIYEVKIRAIAEQEVLVQNDLLDAEFRGDLTLLNNFEQPQITARAELVRGKLMFRNTAFTLDHAIVRAPDPEVFNPQFSIGGSTNVSGYRIGIFAMGTSEAPKISFSSSPALSQEDILSLLAFGYTGEEAKRVDPNEKNALTYTEVGSALLDQLRLNQDLEKNGFKVTVAPSIAQSEASIIHPETKGTSTAAPKVYVRTQILNNLDASLGSTFGTAQTNELDATLEFRVGKQASVNAVYEQEPGAVANEPRRSYGPDIKFRWGFK